METIVVGTQQLKEAASRFLVPYSRELTGEYGDSKDMKGVAVPCKCLKS